VADKTWDPGFQKDPRAEMLKILDCSDFLSAITFDSDFQSPWGRLQGLANNQEHKCLFWCSIIQKKKIHNWDQKIVKSNSDLYL